MSIEELLEVLGNQTRLRILRSLAVGPKYLLELARELNLSEPAILKHLNILERYGLISSFKRNSSIGPPRKYYYLKTGFSIDLGFTDGVFDISIRSLEESICGEVEGVKGELENIKRIEDCREAIERISILSELVDRDLTRLRMVEASLLALKREIYRYLDELLRILCDTYIERRLAERIILSRGKEMDLLLDELREIFNLTDTEFRLILDKLRAKIPCLDRFIS
ncbi:MAG: ArsR family transcriptional regulator [Candidatus Bathyarchaeia archaeon]